MSAPADPDPARGQGSPERPPTTTPGRFPWGWIVVAVGIVALAVRYLMWPLGATGLTGGLVGIVMVGLQIEKQRRSAAGKPLPAATTVLTIAVAAAVSLAAAALRPSFTDTVTPRTVYRLPGLEVTAPAWNVSESGTGFELGGFKLDDPEGSGRFLEVHWAFSDPQSPQEFAAIWTQMGFKVVGTAKASVSGHEATRFELTMPDGSKLNFATAWFCPQYGREQYVLSFLSRPRGSLLALHEEVAGSLKCHCPVDGAIPKRIFPVFNPPPGYQEHTAANARLYTNGSDTYCFNPAFSDPKLVATLASSPDMATKIVAAIFETQNLALGRPEQRRDRSGDLRYVWTGKATLEGTACRIVFVAWTRSGDERTFMGFYAGPASATGPDPVDVLLTAQ